MATCLEALRYADALAAASGRSSMPCPHIVDGLIARARDGDMKVALYLVDRLLANAVGARAAPHQKIKGIRDDLASPNPTAGSESVGSDSHCTGLKLR